MARTRTIKPAFWEDPKLAQLTRDARLLYIGMWNFADDYGNIKGTPIWLKNQIFAFDDIPLVDFISYLDELERLDRIIKYEINNELFYHIANFTKHQYIQHPSRAKNPTPDLITSTHEASHDAHEDNHNSHKSSHKSHEENKITHKVSHVYHDSNKTSHEDNNNDNKIIHESSQKSHEEAHEGSHNPHESYHLKQKEKQKEKENRTNLEYILKENNRVDESSSPPSVLFQKSESQKSALAKQIDAQKLREAFFVKFPDMVDILRNQFAKPNTRKLLADAIDRLGLDLAREILENQIPQNSKSPIGYFRKIAESDKPITPKTQKAQEKKLEVGDIEKAADLAIRDYRDGIRRKFEDKLLEDAMGKAYPLLPDSQKFRDKFLETIEKQKQELRS